MDRAKLDIRGIKCDNKKCSFVDMSVEREDYDNWLNRQCPECGGNLLTKEDYDLIKKMEKGVSFMNSFLPKSKKGDIFTKTSIKLDGTGLIKDRKTTILNDEN